MTIADLEHFAVVIFAITHLLGVAAAIHAIMRTRTPQGTFAWALALIAIPYISLPCYLVFGRNKFLGYVRARRRENQKLSSILDTMVTELDKYQADITKFPFNLSVFENLAKQHFTRFNEARPLINGEETFSAIFSAIRQAKAYVLVQFYIIRDDSVGRKFSKLLQEKAKEGVAIYFLFDEIGSYDLPNRYIRELNKGGVRIFPFKTTRGPTSNRFQLNFRNHRKLEVVDGQIGFVGGQNIGNEYRHRIRKSKTGPFRDTGILVEGPVVQSMQLSFVEDWHWSTGQIPKLDWQYRGKMASEQTFLTLAPSPADTLETCSLFFLHAINSAKKRIWITSPYFVPDSQILSALQLAVMRGVEVKIIIPGKADHLMVYLASFSYFSETLPYGVQLYRYETGFIHQKVLLIDDELAAVGTANFDNRSFRLNFEIMLLGADRKFAQQIEAMLIEDLKSCKRVTLEEFLNRSFWFHFVVRISRLFAPVL